MPDEFVMKLTNCTIELQNAQGCDTTDDDSSNTARYIKFSFHYSSSIHPKTTT
jgi:hypothetical protein